MTFSRALSRLHVIAGHSDWFIALFAAVVIGQSNDFVIDFSTVIIGKPLCRSSLPAFALFVRL